MSDLIIEIKFPLDRTKTGTLELRDGSRRVLAGPFDAYGKADSGVAAQHGNPDRDPVLPYGDTPEGSYSVPMIVDTGDGTRYSSHSYGPHAAIVLAPESGDAAIAEGNGRSGLLIHSGDLGDGGLLRATHGCVRVSNGDMEALLAALRRAAQNPVLQRCDVIRMSVIVGKDGVEGAGEDEADPPPGIEQLLSPGTMP